MRLALVCLDKCELFLRNLPAITNKTTHDRIRIETINLVIYILFFWNIQSN